MTDPEIRADIPCLVHAGRNEVRGTLQLPGQPGMGHLQLEDDVPNLPEDGGKPLALTLLDDAAGTPATLVSWFVRRRRHSFPVPPPFPLELHVNRALTGTHDPAQELPSAAVTSQPAVSFLSPKVDPAAALHFPETRHLHLNGELPSGDRFELAEVVTRDLGESSMTFETAAEVKVDGPPRTLEDWSDPLTRLLGLLAFCLDRPLAPERVFTPGEDGEIELHAAWREPTAPTKTQPLFLLEELGDGAGGLFCTWMSLHEDAPDLMAHVVEFQSRRKNLLPSDQLILLARALELMHGSSSRFESGVRPKAEHKHLVTTVLNGLDGPTKEEHGEWIEAALRESNRKRLRLQVTELAQEAGPDILSILDLSDADEFASDLIKTRNYVTHPGKQAPPTASGRSLVQLVHRAWFLLRAVLLAELGVEPDEIAKALGRSSGSVYLLRD